MRERNAGKKRVCVCVCLCAQPRVREYTSALSESMFYFFLAEFKDQMQKTPVKRQYRPCGKWPLQPFYPSRPLLECSGILVASPLTLGRCMDSHSGSHALSTPARVDGQSHVCAEPLALRCSTLLSCEPPQAANRGLGNWK